MTSRGLVAYLTVAAVLSGVLSGCRANAGGSIEGIMAASPDRFGTVLDRASEVRFQVVLSEVVGRAGQQRIRRSAYRARAEYFYPASAIKLCAAVAAVQAVEAISQRASRAAGSPIPTLDTPLIFHPLFPGEVTRDRDPTNIVDGAITLRHEIRKLFLVSDNEAFNRLYDFVGHSGLNESMQSLGLESVVINHRLSVGRSLEENRCTRRIDALCAEGVFTIPERSSHLILRNADMAGLSVGTAHLASGGQLRIEPMDFTMRNGIAIDELQDLLIALVRPDLDTGRPPLLLSSEHRRFLVETMAEYPGDSPNPLYPRSEYPDDWGKFFLPGLLRVNGRTRADLVICNKVGQAYGFTVDNAYIKDLRSGREFFLTAVIYTNADGVLNDDAYEYSDFALPFMADLAEAVARSVWGDPGQGDRAD